MNSELINKVKDYPRPFPRVRTLLTKGQFDTGIKTSQEYKVECDINNIVKSWTSTGVCPSVNVKAPLFVDCTIAKSFTEQAQALVDAQDAFMQLDPKIRKEFDNSPVKLCEFLADKSNEARAIELGLIDKKQDVNQASAVAPQGQAIGEASTDKKGA